MAEVPDKFDPHTRIPLASRGMIVALLAGSTGPARQFGWTPAGSPPILSRTVPRLQRDVTLEVSQILYR